MVIGTDHLDFAPRADMLFLDRLRRRRICPFFLVQTLPSDVASFLLADRLVQMICALFWTIMLAPAIFSLEVSFHGFSGLATVP